MEHVPITKIERFLDESKDRGRLGWEFVIREQYQIEFHQSSEEHWHCLDIHWAIILIPNPRTSLSKKAIQYATKIQRLSWIGSWLYRLDFEMQWDKWKDEALDPKCQLEHTIMVCTIRLPWDLAQGNKRHAVLRDLRYLECRPESRFLRSINSRRKWTGGKWRRNCQVPRMQCDHYQHEFRAPASRQYSFLASSYHLLWRSDRSRWALDIGLFSRIVAYFVISLASTIRFSSFTTRGPTHTLKWSF